MSVQVAAVSSSAGGVDANASTRSSESDQSFSSVLGNARQTSTAAVKSTAASKTPATSSSKASSGSKASTASSGSKSTSSTSTSTSSSSDSSASSTKTATQTTDASSTAATTAAESAAASQLVSNDTSTATALVALVAHAQAVAQGQSDTADGSASDESGAVNLSNSATSGAPTQELAANGALDNSLAQGTGTASLANGGNMGSADFAALLGSGKDKSTAPSETSTLNANSQSQVNTTISSLVADSSVSGSSTIAGSTSQLDTAPPQRAWISEPVTSSQWGQAIGQQALLQVSSGAQSAELHLNPAHLGPMDVKMSVSDEGTTLSFTTHESAVHEALQQSLPKLQQMFADSGLPALNVQVNLGQNSQSGFAGGQGSSSQNGSKSSSNSADTTLTTAVTTSAAASKAYRVSLSGVDVFA